MRVLTILGNRPQFVKAAAVSKRLRRRHEEVVVHSGQHYDDELSGVFFRDLDLPAPDRELGIGSGPNGWQVSAIMAALQPVAQEVQPDLAMVYGDTNTTLAGALACARLDLPVAHVESGMRSFDRSMPEERNRILADHLAALRLCSTDTAVQNLEAEGVTQGVKLVGDVMADVTLMSLPLAEQRSEVLERLGLGDASYALVTAHRAGNVDLAESLSKLVDILLALPLPAVFPVHPRTRGRLEETGAQARLEARGDLLLTPPLGYMDFLKLLRHADVVLTDSGGIQKEAYLLRVPCITLRDRTEWVETVELGWNELVGLDKQRVLEALKSRREPPEHPELYGGGCAGEQVVQTIEEWADRR